MSFFQLSLNVWTFDKGEKIQNCYRSLEITTNPRKMVKQFCESIIQIGIRTSKALANLVMGLASQRRAKSVVEVSLSGCYHYQYSSISKCLSQMDKPKDFKGCSGTEKLGQQELEKKFIREGRLYAPLL